MLTMAAIPQWESWLKEIKEGRAILQEPGLARVQLQFTLDFCPIGWSKHDRLLESELCLSGPYVGLPPPSGKHMYNLNPFWSQQRSLYPCTHLAVLGCRLGALACDLSCVINTCACKLGRSKLSRSERLYLNSILACTALIFHGTESSLHTKSSQTLVWQSCRALECGWGLRLGEIGGPPRMEFCKILAKDSF